MKFLLGILIIISLFSCQKNEERYIRKNIHSIEAAEDVVALNRALQIMREKDCADPISYYYQGAMHWIPDTVHSDLCSSYQNISQLKDGWDNCTHSSSKKEKLHFLIWHRMYIWHFEKIVRRLSGKSDFALPYWAYTNDSDLNKTLHPLFRNKKSSLYSDCRYADLNAGNPITGEIARTLDLTALMKYDNFVDFSNNINAAPHGSIHDYCGSGNDSLWQVKYKNPVTGTLTGTGLMGWVPTAGFDPIFWTHHSNIDRIWQQWYNSKNGELVTLAELKANPWPYVFFDEFGMRVEYSIDEVYKIINNLDYDFDDTPVKPKKRIVKDEPLKTIAVSTELKAKLKGSVNNVSGLHTKKGDHITITVSFSKLPKGAYEVYAGKPGHPKDANFLGFMTFFGKDLKSSGKICKRGCCGELDSEGRFITEFTYRFNEDANEDLHILNFDGNNNGDIRIERILIH